MTKTKLFLLIFLMAMISYSGMAQSEFSSGLIGIGVVTKDIDKSLHFYQNVIGMIKVGEFDVDESSGKKNGLTDGIAFHVDVLKLQDSPDANQWKLMSFKQEGSHPMPAYIHDDTGMQYITLNVKSLQPFLKRIKENEVKLLGETPVRLNETDHFALVQDPDGTFIELIGPLN